MPVRMQYLITATNEIEELLYTEVFEGTEDDLRLYFFSLLMREMEFYKFQREFSSNVIIPHGKWTYDEDSKAYETYAGSIIDSEGKEVCFQIKRLPMPKYITNEQRDKLTVLAKNPQEALDSLTREIESLQTQ